jgi:hypothetical protein
MSQALANSTRKRRHGTVAMDYNTMQPISVSEQGEREQKRLRSDSETTGAVQPTDENEDDDKSTDSGSDRATVEEILKRRKVTLRKKKVTSFIYDHLHSKTLNEQEKIISGSCIHCNTLIDTLKGTSIAISHLLHQHHIKDPKKSKVNEVPKQQTTDPKILQEQFERNLALWIAETAQPFTTVEHPSFIRMLQSYQNGLNVGSAYKVKRVIDDIFHDSRQ